MTDRRDGGARGSFSRLLAELAASPRGAMRSAWDRGFRPGDVIADRFELLEPIGRGGFGVVFKARDRRLNRVVAFKAIPPGGQPDTLVQQEAEVAAQLQHRHLVRLYDFGRCASGAYLIFEVLGGETLARRLRRGPMPVREALRVAEEVASALVHAHARGVLHRDLTPANVLLTDVGEAKVLDFGLAHYFGEGPARAGTPGYMAPEQLRGGPQDARTDVFAVGVLLREMLAGTAIPPALTSLLDRSTAPDPSDRPADATRLLGELQAIRRSLDGARRRRRNALVLGVLLLAGLTTGGLLVDLLGVGRERPVVAVADLLNETDDPDLGAISGLLTTSLEQWPGLSVLPRQRLQALALPGGEGPGQVRCDAAMRAGALAGAVAVMCGRVTREGAGYAVEVAARAPRDGKVLFERLENASTKDGLGPVVDRLSAGVRQELDAPLAPRPREAKVDELVTRSPEAYRHYFQGVQCTDRPVHGQDCSQELRRALELDPGFALAAYQLAVWATWNGRPVSEQRALVARALRLSTRAPEKERMLIRAWAAHLDGNDDAALALLEEVARKWPDDRQAYYQAGDILRHRNELALAVPWFEKAVALDPDFSWALGGLVQSLGALGRHEELRALAAGWERSPGPGTLHALSLARGWLGDLDGAVSAARTGTLLGGGIVAQEDLLQARVFAGDYAGVESDVRALASAGSPVRRVGYYGLAGLEAYRGRMRSGLATLDELEREIPEVRGDAVYHALRADLLLGSGDARATWAEVEAARTLDPHLAAEHAVSLAWLGDLPHAAILARDLPAGTPLADTYAALARIDRGDVQGGLDDLGRIAKAVPVFTWRIAPIFLYADRLAAAGRDREAVEAFRQAQAAYVPLSMWRCWAFPRSLYLLARSYERLGRRPEALESVDRLLAIWSDAEPGLPLLEDARRLRSRVSPP